MKFGRERGGRWRARLSSGWMCCAQGWISGTWIVGGDEIGPAGHDTEEAKKTMQTARRPAGVTPIGRWAGWTGGLPKLPHDPQDSDAFLADFQLTGQPLRPATLGCCPAAFL